MANVLRVEKFKKANVQRVEKFKKANGRKANGVGQQGCDLPNSAKLAVLITYSI